MIKHAVALILRDACIQEFGVSSSIKIIYLTYLFSSNYFNFFVYQQTFLLLLAFSLHWLIFYNIICKFYGNYMQILCKFYANYMQIVVILNLSYSILHFK